MKRPLPPPPAVQIPRIKRGDPLARMLAKSVQDAYGHGEGATLDEDAEIGAPRGWIGTRNIALDRALGSQIPLGRVIEVFGDNASGKSTVADQIGAECQAQGGVYVLADTEHARDRPYMLKLGVDPASTVWIGGNTTELVFSELEAVARRAAGANASAWIQALKLAGFDPGGVPTYVFKTYDPFATDKKTRKVTASFDVAEWSMAASVALRAFQVANGLPATGRRDAATRAALAPVVVYGDDGQPWIGDVRSKPYRAAVEAVRAGEDPGDDALLGHVADRPMVFCWDSVGGTTTRAELEDEAGDAHPGRAAQVLKRNLRRLVQLLDDAAVTLIAVNQEYFKIDTGPMAGRGGPKKDTYGGQGLKYHASMRIEIVRTGRITATAAEDSAQIGQICSARVIKSKSSSPGRREDFALIYGRGADNAWAIYHDLKERGVIAQRGGWSSFTDPTLMAPSWHGWQGLANLIADDAVLWSRLVSLYKEKAC